MKISGVRKIIRAALVISAIALFFGGFLLSSAVGQDFESTYLVMAVTSMALGPFFALNISTSAKIGFSNPRY